MNTVTKKDFADQCGVSKAAIGKACNAGNIATVGLGRKQLINAGHRLTKEYLRGKQGKAPPADKTGSPAKKKTIKPAVTDPDAVQLPLIPLSDINAITRDSLLGYEKKDLDKLKVYEEAKLKNIQVKEKEGQLISRQLVGQVFAKIYTVDTEQLRALEDRLTPVICGICGIAEDSTESVKIRKTINVEVSKALEHIKRIIDAHLVGTGGDKL